MSEKTIHTTLTKQDEPYTSAEEEMQEPISAEEEMQEPTSAEEEMQEPTSAEEEMQEPTSAEMQEPTSAEMQEPTLAEEEMQEPTSAEEEMQEPTSAEEEMQEPTSAEEEMQEPTSPEEAVQEPTSAEVQEPTSAEEEVQEHTSAEVQEPLRPKPAPRKRKQTNTAIMETGRESAESSTISLPLRPTSRPIYTVRAKNLQIPNPLVGKEILHKWKVGKKIITYKGTVTKLVSGKEGCVESIYLVKYTCGDVEDLDIVKDILDGSLIICN